MSLLKAIIFDYGGTLDSRGDHWSEVIWRAYVAEGAIGVDREAFRDAYVHAERALDGSGIILPSDNFLAVMRKKTALQLHHLGIYTPQLSEAIATRCYNAARECTEESRHTLNLLASRYPIAIVSNFYGNIRTVLTDFGLMPCISAVIDSTEAGIRKPDPTIFRLGIDLLAATLESRCTTLCPDESCRATLRPDEPCSTTLRPDEVLVVGDSISKDILPARSLGCRTALLPGIPWDSTRPQPTPPADTIILHTLNDLLEITNTQSEI